MSLVDESSIAAELRKRVADQGNGCAEGLTIIPAIILSRAADYIAHVQTKLRREEEKTGALTTELAAAKKDTERLDTLQSLLFACRWNGVIGADCKWHWEVVGQWRHIVWRMVSKKQGDFRAAIDAAIAAQQPTEPK
ncbi:MAG: hypothetical protein LW865_14620 [Betaproteobacteria bacterium]|jgi:hypothetical protein|nr:hypothetical protein [Betaproteobacteria bacterium]